MVLVFATFAGFSKFTEGSVEGIFVESSPDLPTVDDRAFLVPQTNRDIEYPSLSARSVLVKDRDTRITLLDQDSQDSLPIASLTKLMSAIVVYKASRLDEVVKIESQDVAVPTYRVDLVPGERISVHALLKAMLIPSGNDAAMALARHSGKTVPGFVKMMNAEAQRLGMNGTMFANPVGLDDPDNYSTAADMYLLVKEFEQYPELVTITGTKETSVSSIDGSLNHHLVTSNKLLGVYPGVSGIKTGFTTEAKGNLILSVNDGGYGYEVILIGSEDRENDGARIIDWVNRSYKWQ